MAKKSNTSLVTVEELVESWKGLTAEEESRAEVLLLQASNYLRLIAMNNNKDLDDLIEADQTGVYGANVKTVILAAVQRSIASPIDMMPDASQFSQSASPYSESMSFSGEVSSTIFFKTRELRLLGLSDVAGKKSIALLRGVR